MSFLIDSIKKWRKARYDKMCNELMENTIYFDANGTKRVCTKKQIKFLLERVGYTFTYRLLCGDNIFIKKFNRVFELVLLDDIKLIPDGKSMLLVINDFNAAENEEQQAAVEIDEHGKVVYQYTGKLVYTFFRLNVPTF